MRKSHGEIGIYVGNNTAMAATARGETLRRGMTGGALGRLTTMAKVILGLPIGSTRPIATETEKWARGTLRGLGHPPDRHTLSRKGDKLLVRDHLGEPVRWYSAAHMKALECDVDFLREFEKELT